MGRVRGWLARRVFGADPVPVCERCGSREGLETMTVGGMSLRLCVACRARVRRELG